MIFSQPIASHSSSTHRIYTQERYQHSMMCCKVLVAAIVVAFVWSDTTGVVVAAVSSSSLPDYDNTTVRYMTEDGGGQLPFQFNARTPRKRGRSRNNLLSFDTRNNNIEVWH